MGMIEDTRRNIPAAASISNAPHEAVVAVVITVVVVTIAILLLVTEQSSNVAHRFFYLVERETDRERETDSCFVGCNGCSEGEFWSLVATIDMELFVVVLLGR